MADYFEVAPGVAQVPVLGAQVWLLTDGPLTLVDAGTRGSGRAILRAIKRLGHQPADLAAVVLTHYHPDHVGALPQLLTALAHMPYVAIHAAEAPFLRAPAAMPVPSTRHWPTPTRCRGAPTPGWSTYRATRPAAATSTRPRGASCWQA